MTLLNLYSTNQNDTLLTTARQFITTGGGTATNAFNSLIGTSTGFGEMWSQSNAGAWAAVGSIGSPSGRGFILDATTLEGQQILAGNWTPTFRGKVSVGTIVADIYVRAFVYNGGTYTQIGSTMVLTGQTLTTSSTNFVFSATSQPVQNFGTGDKIYVDVWLNITTNSTGSGTATAGIVEATSSTNGATSSFNIQTPGYQPIPSSNPVLATSPSSLSFSATHGGSSPAPLGVTLLETAGFSTNWTSSISYGSGSGWLAISPTSGMLAANGNTSVSFTATLGSLAIGTYSATVTFTAVTGGSTATVSVTFTVSAPTGPAYSVKLAGQDITLYVEQASIVINDTLGQGGGAGSSGSTQGRAATIKFNTNLGPMSQAIGAGQPIPTGGTPVLVRQGEIIVTDNSGTVIFGGFITKYTDTSTSVLGQTRKNFTAVEGIDYSTSLQRTMVNESFSAQTDIQIISFVLQKYAPWIKLNYLPTQPAYTFPIKNFRNVTVEQVIQTIAGVTGYLVFVDYLKYLHYLPPTTASSAPFNVSDQPDFVTTFPHGVAEFLTDDNSAINRVRFSGGTRLSNDIFQDVSPLANGNNKIFMLAYFATQQSDGKYHVKLNGVEQVVGFANATGAANTLISAGGTAQCIIDPGSRTVTFDVAPASGASVLIGYRYSFPMTLVLTDENSHKFFGDPYLDGSLDDNTVFDLATAVQRCKVLLAQQSYGLTTLKIDVWKAGIQAGMVLSVTNTLRGINGTYLVQEVEISPLGAGNFVYHITLGAWNWNLIDFLLKLPTLATFQTDQQTTDEIVIVESILTNVQVHDAWAKKTSTQGLYYARSAPVGDGSDAYPGFATITS